MNCDILVIGASSAGLMAAISAAIGGASVILLDKDLQRLKHSANTLFEGMAVSSGIKVEDCYLQKELEEMRIYQPLQPGVTIQARGYFIDRQRFDDYYLRLAEKAGVALLTGQGRGLTQDGSRRTVASGEEKIQAQVVIDASGVQSGIAREAGLEPMRHPDDIAWAMEADIEHPGLGEEMFFQYWIGGLAPGWKATFSPTGGNQRNDWGLCTGPWPKCGAVFPGISKAVQGLQSQRSTGISKTCLYYL